MKNKDIKENDSDDVLDSSEAKVSLDPKKLSSGTSQILIAMGLETLVSTLLEKTRLTYPAYIGAMLIDATIRNISEISKIYETPMFEINNISKIALSLFLSMALMNLKLWELAGLAIPFLVMIVGQVLLVLLFENFVTFNAMGRDYDAAILAAGHCGFGLGATANGIAVMDSVTDTYAP